MKKYRKDTRLEVHWNDIKSDPNWQNNDEAKCATPVQCKTIGYYTIKRKDVLVSSHNTHSEQRDTTVIPLGFITEVIELIPKTSEFPK